MEQNTTRDMKDYEKLIEYKIYRGNRDTLDTIYVFNGDEAEQALLDYVLQEEADEVLYEIKHSINSMIYDTDPEDEISRHYLGSTYDDIAEEQGYFLNSFLDKYTERYEYIDRYSDLDKYLIPMEKLFKARLAFSIVRAENLYDFAERMIRINKYFLVRVEEDWECQSIDKRDCEEFAIHHTTEWSKAAKSIIDEGREYSLRMIDLAMEEWKDVLLKIDGELIELKPNNPEDLI